MLQAIIALDDAARLQAIHSRHVPIHQHQPIGILGIGGGYLPHGFLPRRNRLGAERKYAQRIGENLARLRIVIDNQGPDTRQIRNEALAFLL